MAGFLLRLLVVALGLWLASELVPGIAIQGAGTLLGAALLLGIVNASVRPLLVINAAMLGLVAWVFDHFTIAGFWSAVFGAIVVSATGWLASYFIGPRGRIEIMIVRHKQ